MLASKYYSFIYNTRCIEINIPIPKVKKIFWSEHNMIKRRMYLIFLSKSRFKEKQIRHPIYQWVWKNMIDDKPCNLNFFVTFNLPDGSRERSSSSKSSAELQSRIFSKRSIVAKKFKIARLIISFSHPYTFYILLKLVQTYPCTFFHNKEFLQ